MFYVHVKSSFIQPCSIPLYYSWKNQVVFVHAPMFVCVCKLFSPHLGNQFTYQPVPLTIRLQASIFVVWSNVDFILKAQIIGQSIQDVNGITLVLLWFPQNIL